MKCQNSTDPKWSMMTDSSNRKFENWLKLTVLTFQSIGILKKTRISCVFRGAGVDSESIDIFIESPRHMHKPHKTKVSQTVVKQHKATPCVLLIVILPLISPWNIASYRGKALSGSYAFSSTLRLWDAANKVALDAFDNNCIRCILHWRCRHFATKEELGSTVISITRWRVRLWSDLRPSRKMNSFYQQGRSWHPHSEKKIQEARTGPPYVGCL